MTEWHLDRKVTLAVIMALTLNAFSLLGAVAYVASWKTTIELKVSNLETRSNNNRQTLERTQLIVERLVKVETEVVAVKESLQRIERTLTKIFDK